MIITIIIMNMQKNLYTIQFFSPPNDRFTAPKKTFELLAKSGFEKTPGN